ncbi:DUF397 domain-containing protein [Actinomadura gamaensis]|uniref:DUF397 domain-containing protein n=1 Tax=Actinomadura gamaensis TaxID=1763541 RepID=A0ABV9U7L6_9ACTN
MARWRKSSYSEGSVNGACVELGVLEAGVLGIRDSKAPRAGHLTVPADGLRALLARIRGDSMNIARV